MIRAACRALLLVVGSWAMAWSGCAGRPHALDYVVFPNHEAQREAPPPQVAGREPERTDYPIWGDTPPPTPAEAEASGVGGAGSAGCSVGLAGEVCEVGILAGETPLEERELLPPDGRVFQRPLPAPGQSL